MMQLGFVSAILPELSLEQVLEVAAQQGYDCVELMCWPSAKAERRYAGVTHITAAGLTESEAARLRGLIKRSGVAVSGLGYYPNPLAPDEGEARVAVEHLKHVISAAALLEVGVVNTFVGRDWTRSIDGNWARFQQTWPGIVAHAESCGVRIGIENCPMLFTQDEWPGGKNLAINPVTWRRMFAEIPSRSWGLNYDPSHLIWQHMDPVKPIHEFADRFVHVHAKDARIDRERLDDAGILATPLEYHRPKLPGLGDMDWSRFFATLGDAGYEGPVCVEVEDRAYEKTLEDRKAALQQCAAFLRNYIPRRCGQSNT
jgi:sugar phosphate isomerase/epimerase